MATTRSSRASERRARQAAEGRTERRIYLAVAAVGVAVLAIVITGVVLTVVLPPRSGVVKVGDRSFTARDLAVRAKYAVIVEQNGTVATDPAAAIPLLARDEVLRQKVGDLGVSAATDDELEAAIRKKIGSAPDTAAAVFQNDYTRYLESHTLDRTAFEAVVRIEVVRDKAIASFKTKVPEAGPQIHILGVSSADRQKLDDLRAAVASGKDFKAESFARGLVEEADQADLSWVNPDGLPENLAALGKLNVGDLSEVIADQRTGSFFLAKVIEREESRKYAESMVEQIANRQLLDWVKQQEAALVGPSSLSGSAESWVIRQVKDAVTESARRTQAAQAQK